MPSRRTLVSGPAAWKAMAALLALPAVAAWFTQPLSSAVLAWQAAAFPAEPWRVWSAAWVHWSAGHLGANLAATALLLMLGLTARLPRAAAWAWAAAWPLTHLSLVLQPELHRYGGLSGVLHAGVAVVAVHLLLAPDAAAQPDWRRRARWIGLALAGGLMIKVLLEAPWRAALVVTPDWDFPVAPLAHAAGAFWGTLCGAAVVALPRRAVRT